MVSDGTLQQFVQDENVLIKIQHRKSDTLDHSSTSLEDFDGYASKKSASDAHELNKS